MSRILGIDPGSRITGYGIIEAGVNSSRYIASGSIRIKADTFPQRLKQVFDGITEVIAMYSPEQMAIEQVFMHKNADSALKLGQARGAAICAALNCDLPVHEYAARQIKQALVGKGNADKAQVQHMVKILLNIQGTLQVDAGDALGVCLCHSHHQQTQQRLSRAGL
ncbi:crossover junction endodeoxyribonuclease RuvC [methane-oxidizing endosymbiont of Gigantopelta aegis]|uniref:crossover junction endodeoxyribonuclease RuvC n=1 Tax=methane-oxidizing endosymbiont of Gigantopelta aegis TaxID=2794938 RepID=UPI0018DB1923|nr:crossover junction endodeoxyribonuclease RuvC [methane-oxidizing endosymbiont of Gigantopelta aegis]